MHNLFTVQIPTRIHPGHSCGCENPYPGGVKFPWLAFTQSPTPFPPPILGQTIYRCITQKTSTKRSEANDLTSLANDAIIRTAADVEHTYLTNWWTGVGARVRDLAITSFSGLSNLKPHFSFSSSSSPVVLVTLACDLPFNSPVVFDRPDSALHSDPKF